jgi:hypothetical protein
MTLCEGRRTLDENVIFGNLRILELSTFDIRNGKSEHRMRISVLEKQATGFC